ncbi:MAG: ABC transporter substrate-binding protein [Cyanobacteria bacterium P01_H01_bin.15]
MGTLVACSDGSPSSSVTPENMSNAVVVDEAQPEAPVVSQIVALTSLTADIIETLDSEKLVGISGSRILSQDERFAGLETVSEGRTEPDLEKIIALEPDLVIGAKGFHDRTLASLHDLEIETLAVDVKGWGSLRELTQQLAQKIGADPAPLMERYDACLAKTPDSGPTALVLVSRQPLLSPNKQSWAGDFLAKFQLENLTAQMQGESPFEGYITLSEEKVLTSNPDILLVVETGDNLLAQLQQDPFWGQLKATQEGQVYTVDYFGLVNPGNIASIEAVCDKLSTL